MVLKLEFPTLENGFVGLSSVPTLRLFLPSDGQSSDDDIWLIRVDNAIRPLNSILPCNDRGSEPLHIVTSSAPAE